MEDQAPYHRKPKGRSPEQLQRDLELLATLHAPLVELLRSQPELEALSVNAGQTMEHEFEHIPEEQVEAAVKAALIALGIDPGIEAFEDLQEIFHRALLSKAWRDKILLR